LRLRQSARSLHVGSTRRFGPALATINGEGENNALDNLCSSAGFVGVGNGNLLHRRRADSHPVGAWFDSAGIPPDSGAQGAWLGPSSRLGEKKMPLINIVIALIVVGVALWLINNFIPMAGSIKSILNVVVVVAVAIWVLQAVGLWGRVTSYRFTTH
jgi:hypothetical protein